MTVSYHKRGTLSTHLHRFCTRPRRNNQSTIALAGDGTDALIEALRSLGRRGVLRAARKASPDAQLAMLGALIESVELHGERRMRVVYRGNATAPEWVEVGARD